MKPSRKYYIHWRLRKLGYKVKPKQRTIFKKHDTVDTPIVKKYFAELKKLSYEVQTALV